MEQKNNAEEKEYEHPEVIADREGAAAAMTQEEWDELAVDMKAISFDEKKGFYLGMVEIPNSGQDGEVSGKGFLKVSSISRSQILDVVFGQLEMSGLEVMQYVINNMRGK